MPFFSVIIPSYNRSSLLKEALESVFSQTFKDYEVIVVDDGSTDDTLKMLSHYGDRVKVLQQKNSGPGAARNRGAEAASGDYLAFLDSDDMWFSWALCSAKDAIIENLDPAIVIFGFKEFSEASELRDVVKTETKLIRYPDLLVAHKREGYSILSCSLTVVRRCDFIKVGGFSSKRTNAEDLDLWMKLSDTVGAVEMLSPICCGYRRHAGSAVSDLKKTYLGLLHLIQSEIDCRYPGGFDRAEDRRRVITRYTRAASLALAKLRKPNLALDLYIRTIAWNTNELRIKYILGCIVIIILNILKSQNETQI